MSEPQYTQPPYGAPQSGAPQYGAPQYGAPGAGERYNVLAIVSFVSSFFISLAGIITGHIALSQIKRTGERGRGFAIAGLVIGYVGLLIGIITVIAVIAFGAVYSTGTIPTY